jgi:hypothetical protein
MCYVLLHHKASLCMTLYINCCLPNPFLVFTLHQVAKQVPHALRQLLLPSTPSVNRCSSCRLTKQHVALFGGVERAFAELNG